MKPLFSIDVSISGVYTLKCVYRIYTHAHSCLIKMLVFFYILMLRDCDQLVVSLLVFTTTRSFRNIFISQYRFGGIICCFYCKETIRETPCIPRHSMKSGSTLVGSKNPGQINPLVTLGSVIRRGWDNSFPVITGI